MPFKQKSAVVVVAVQQSYWGKQWQHVRTNLYDSLWSTHFQHLTATLASIVKRQPHDLSKLRKLATTTYRDGSSQLLDRSKLYVETNMQDFSFITNSTVNRPTIFMSLLIHCDHLFCQSACFSGGSIFWTFGSLSFCTAVPIIWNTLASSIHLSQTLGSFWKHPKTQLFQSPFNNL